MSKRSFIGVKYGRVQIKGVFEGLFFFNKIKFVFEFKLLLHPHLFIYLFEIMLGGVF